MCFLCNSESTTGWRDQLNESAVRDWHLVQVQVQAQVQVQVQVQAHSYAQQMRSSIHRAVLPRGVHMGDCVSDLLSHPHRALLLQGQHLHLVVGCI